MIISPIFASYDGISHGHPMTTGCPGLEEGSPIFKQMYPFYFKPLSIFIHTTNRISFDLFS